MSNNQTNGCGNSPNIIVTQGIATGLPLDGPSLTIAQSLALARAAADAATDSAATAAAKADIAVAAFADAIDAVTLIGDATALADAVAASAAAAATRAIDAAAAATSAESAATRAGSSAATAEARAEGAETAASGASASAIAASNSAASVIGLAAAAGVSAGAASVSEEAASLSEATALTQAAIATGKAEAAGTSATAAATQAGIATDRAAAAADSSTAASASATASETSAASVRAQDGVATAAATAAAASAAKSESWASRAESTVTGLLRYIPGGWNAAGGVWPENPPSGGFWKVTGSGVIPGVDGASDVHLSPGDQIIYTGDGWDVIDNTEQVTMVAGRVGEVVITINDLDGLRGELDSKLPVLGTAAAAAKLATPRKINGKAFDGTADIAVGIDDMAGLRTALDAKLDSTATAAAATVLAAPRAFNLSGVVTSAAVSFNGSTTVTLITSIADGALVIAKTAGLRNELDGKAAISGQAFTGPVSAPNLSGTNTGDQASVPGNAGTATKLATPRTIAGAAFDGTANITISYENLEGLPVLGTAAAQAASVFATDVQGAKADAALPSTGTAAAATKLATPRKINGTNFDGSSDIAIGQIAGINPQAGATYTPAISDMGKLLKFTHGGATTLNLPPNSEVAFPINTYLLFQAYGTGVVTGTAKAGATVRAPNGAATKMQYDTRGALKLDLDEWVIL